MSVKKIIKKAINKSNFSDIKNYILFCEEFLSYIKDNHQAIIISQNENHYNFYQYDKTGNYQITRPINSNLMYKYEDFKKISKEYVEILRKIKTINKNDLSIRKILNNATYTIQQSIGAVLDALPAGKSNTARKLNGDLFENFIRIIISEIGLNCDSGVVQIPVIVNGEKV